MDTSTLASMAPVLDDPQAPQQQNTKTAVNVLDLIVARIRLLAILRIAWLRKLWKDNGNGEGQPVNYHNTIDSILWNKDNFKDYKAWISGQAQLTVLTSELQEIEKTLSEDKQSLFARLRLQLGINRQEADFLQLCVALALHPKLASVYAYLQDHSSRRYVTDSLYGALFETTDLAVYSPASPLKLWDLIRKQAFDNGDPAIYECDPHIIDFLLGKPDMDTVLMGFAQIQPPKPPLPNWPMEKTLGFISKTLEHNPFQGINISITGCEGSGRKTFAAAVCQQMKLPIMILDVDRIADDKWEKVYTHAQRYAYLDNCAIGWKGGQWNNKFWPKVITPFQIQFNICEPNDHHLPPEGVIDYQVDISAFSIEERRQLWSQFVPQAAEWAPEDREALINRFQITIGQVIDVAQRPISHPAEVAHLLNSSTSHRFGKLAQYLECPFTWEDLVLKDNLKNYLSEFLYEAREREALWESHTTRRLFPQGKGLMALFSGPPGTGKTMAAQVIASSLDLDLYRIDLSSIVSKYVGETSKNIERILSKAGQVNAVLLFDEADALFGKRTEVKDAHDRYANTDTNYLLQAIESYSGIAVLATNKKSNIDSGFLRRLRYVLEFQKPDAEQRINLWLRIVGELAGESSRKRLEEDLIKLAKMVHLTGAQIKFTVLSAVFLSRKEGKEIGMSHLLNGLTRELMKEGRNLKSDVRTKFFNDQ